MDLVGAAQMHRGDRFRVRAALVGRGAGGDVADPGDPRRDDRHMRRCDHRVAAARHIAAHTTDRDVLVAEHDAGRVSTSTSRNEARWISAKWRICAWANLMSSIVSGATLATSAAISSSERRKLAGD